ncbi:MAG: chemotaxis protein CheW [Thermodesulfobacteriota bacterium]
MDIAEIRKKAGKTKKPKVKESAGPVESTREVPAGKIEGWVVKGPSAPAEKDAKDTKEGETKFPEGWIAPTEKVYRESLETEQAEAEEVQEILTFFLDKEEYALEVGVIREIIKPRELTDVPNAPSFVSGIISLRGEVLPVVDLRKRFGLKATDINRKSRIIITTDEDKKIGLIVDSVTQVIKILKKEIEPPPSFQEGINVEFIKGICHNKGRFIILLNLVKVLEW